jgi:Tol biopolymer transport system component
LYLPNFDLSPDGTQIAVGKKRGNSAQDIWLLEWKSKRSARFTIDQILHPQVNAVWSHDGQRIAFSAMRERNGNRDVFERKSSGNGDDIRLTDLPNHEWPEDWSKDGRYLVYNEDRPAEQGNNALHVLELFGERKSYPIVPSRFDHAHPRFSNDGKWLAYASNESGTMVVWVTSFPNADRKHLISNNGGTQPQWRGDDRELYYLDSEGSMMVVDINMGSGTDPGIPRKLFDTGLTGLANHLYNVTPDGERFLILKPTGELEGTPITVVLNWTAALPNQ